MPVTLSLRDINVLSAKMVDTVRYKFPMRPWSGISPAGWKLTEGRHAVCNGGEDLGITTSCTRCFIHGDTGLRVWGDLQGAKVVEVSLPRLQFPHNGFLLASQEEIDAALKKADALVAQVAAAPESRQFTRVDLVWQFRVLIPLFLLAHRAARHSGIRGEPILRKWTSLFWAGSKMKVRMYDKLNQLAHQAGDILRVEVELHHEKLSRELNGNLQPVTKLDFAACYAAYRRLVLGFVPAGIPSSSNLGEFLALAEKEGWSAGGASALEIYSAGLCKKQASRLRRAVAAARPTTFQVDWKEMLPETGPPPAVHCDGVKRKTKVRHATPL